jgi:hypothetical protein
MVNMAATVRAVQPMPPFRSPESLTSLPSSLSAAVHFTLATASQKESALSFEGANLQSPPTQLVEATERAILFWLKSDPQSLNWWWNE